MEKVAALGDMTKDMASRVREGANLQGLTKVTLRSKVIPLDLKKAVSCQIRLQFICICENFFARLIELKI